MKKVLPGGGTVIGIPKKQVMKFNIVTGFQNLVCFYAITKTNFEIKPLSQHPGLALKKRCFLAEQRFKYSIQLP